MSGGGERPRPGPDLSRTLRWLARRPRTELETARRLGEEGLGEERIEEILAEWRRLGYLDDRRLAYTYLSARSSRRLEGRRKLVAELQQRGVAGPLLDEVAPEAVDDEAEDRHLRRLLARRLEADGVPGGPRERARLVRYLERKGFEGEAARRALAELPSPGGDDALE